jgi:hypothetical protein
MKQKLLVCSAIFALLTLVMVPSLAVTEEVPSPAPTPAAASSDPLLQVLVSKGVITVQEARFVSAGTAADQRDKLILLLKEKGLISNNDVDQIRAYQPVAGAPTLQSATMTVSQTAVPAQAPAKPAPPKFIPAVAPLRVLQTEPSKKDGLVPDIKLGSGAKIKLYGFLKASTMYDSSQPYGTDFPLPGFIGVNSNSAAVGIPAPAAGFDTGTGPGKEFHVKARFARVGANFEFPDVSDKLSFTGKLEFDFEGNFSRATNRNISSIRSSMASIRLAYGRMDYKISDKTTAYGVFGQDWTPFGSSSLPNLLETTGLGLGFGTLYERAPQMRGGIIHVIGGDRKVTIMPEFAIVMPTFGNTPLNVADQLGYGERQGADSGRPEFEGRMVLQWQLDKSPGVAPAQIVSSFTQGSRTAVLRAADIPTCVGAFCGGNANFFKAAFPTGTNITSSRWGVSGEVQLPTRWVTVVSKYYQGQDLRFFFAGQLLSNFNNNAGLSNLTTSPNIDGSSTALFGTDSTGAARVAPQSGVHTQGGFINLGFPLGRLAHADPAGRNAGWQLYAHYGIDQAKAADARRTSATGANGNVRNKSDLTAATLLWKFNNLITFAYEQSYYRTRMAGNGTVSWADRNTVPGSWPLWMGKPARSWHDNRGEFSTIFTF